MSGSEEEEFLPEDVAYDDVVIAQEEISQSLKKMNKIVNNLMARADCVPFREPVDWKGLEVSMNVYFIYLWCYVLYKSHNIRPYMYCKSLYPLHLVNWTQTNKIQHTQQLYDYPKIVAKMMDLGTIKKKLEKGKYNF